MSEDPIVEEVRAVRRQHAEQFGYDLQAIVADIQLQEKNCGAKFVKRPYRQAITWRAPIAHKRKEGADQQH
jgi:hypothetical protein